ncbi:MAG: hypothetical protein Aurels2KO_25670 [Aureliella sp.]
MTRDEAIDAARMFTRREKAESRRNRVYPIIATPVRCGDEWRVHLRVRFATRSFGTDGCAFSSPLEVMFGHWQLDSLFAELRRIQAKYFSHGAKVCA